MATEVVMPQLGESVEEGTIGKWLKQVGDAVREYEGLLEVETDKVDTEIPAPVSGTILKILAPEGQTVRVGTVLALIGVPEEASTDAPSAAPESSTVAQAVKAEGDRARTSNGGNGGSAHPRVSPVVANIAAEHRVDVSRVEGTGMGGRVTKKDILNFIEQGPAPAPVPSLPAGRIAVATPTYPTVVPSDHVHKAPAALGRPGDVVPLSKMRRRIAEHMVESKLKTAPHVTTVFEADMSAISAHRKANKDEMVQRGINLTFTAYFVAAIAESLRKHPMVNSSWTDEGVLLHPNVNVGMAVAIDEGLIVPVIKHADEKSLAGIARDVNDLANRARSGQLSPDDIQGGTFTITNHGVSGSLFATPIINQPQTGILGVGAMQKRVVVLENDAMAIRPMIYITLTFDHRILDGAAADFFVAEIKKILENWQ
jgi:2-oxoglutarate dehydrogenase complex dihydrolipoamide succinyltransferase (E2) component